MNVELKVFKATWGMTGTWETQLRQIAEAGYDGVECGIPGEAEEPLLRELLDKYRLELILLVYTGGGDHIASLEEQVRRASSFKPILINSHSAKDSMPYDDQLAFFQHAVGLEKEIGVPIAHETHRGRALFTPWNTARLLQDLPDLHIAADFSHWCCVCESLLSDQTENVTLAAKHAIHIHGRVGYEQGPQVPDFRAPEYEYALLQHEQWWDEICDFHQAAGTPFVTFTPEFGPPGYMHTQPYTKQPVVDLWDICLAMAQRFRDRYKHRYGGTHEHSL
jgi:hypothetical protein